MCTYLSLPIYIYIYIYVYTHILIVYAGSSTTRGSGGRALTGRPYQIYSIEYD